jgi:murein DD-endopeptidase MepM/ murein hydrolase activator NlpD
LLAALVLFAVVPPGPVVRPFEPPPTPYAAGHLGVDFAAAPGSPIRAVAPGVVTFAGDVAGARHVVVRLADGRRVSYSFVERVLVRPGDRVGEGAVLATSGGRGPHHDGSVWHLGLRVGDRYVDPMVLFGRASRPPAIHLAPVGAPARAPADERRQLGAGLPPDDYPIMCAHWIDGSCAAGPPKTRSLQ